MIEEKQIITARQKVGQFLKIMRKVKKITRYALAKEAGINIHQLNSVEKGDRSYTIDTYLRVAKALKCKIMVDCDGEQVEL